MVLRRFGAGKPKIQVHIVKDVGLSTKTIPALALQDETVDQEGEALVSKDLDKSAATAESLAKKLKEAREEVSDQKMYIRQLQHEFDSAMTGRDGEYDDYMSDLPHEEGANENVSDEDEWAHDEHLYKDDMGYSDDLEED